MLGLVVVEKHIPEGALRAGGLSVPLRALLALQAAGCDTLGFVGRNASAWTRAVSRDDRLRSTPRAYATSPPAPYVAVADDVVIDTRTARTLMARPGALFVERDVVAVHRVRAYEGGALDDTGDGAIERTACGTVAVVRDASDVRVAERALLEGLRKPHDGVVSRAINRALSLRVTRMVAPMGVRPNQLSVFILAFGVAGAVLAAQGTWITMAFGGVCFNLQSILDGCDGELARLTFRGSRLGEWIDTVGDDLTNYGFFAGATLGLHRAGFGTPALIAGAVGVGAGLIASSIEYVYLMRIGSGDLLKYPLGFGADPDPRQVPEGFFTRIAGALRPMFKRDFFVFATMIASIAGLSATLAMLCAFAIGACITLSAVLRSEWRRRGRVP